MLTNCLTTIVPSLIHPDQAGFMKGQRIEDQIELIKVMINRCKADDTNGEIVCLRRKHMIRLPMNSYGPPCANSTSVYTLSALSNTSTPSLRRTSSSMAKPAYLSVSVAEYDNATHSHASYLTLQSNP
jgi:hypothetical protein